MQKTNEITKFIDRFRKEQFQTEWHSTYLYDFEKPFYNADNERIYYLRIPGYTIGVIVMKERLIGRFEINDVGDGNAFNLEPHILQDLLNTTFKGAKIE